MKKIALLALFIGTMPLSMQAQDDMYLIPSKSKKVANSSVVTKDSKVTYSGSDRDVDEYNRHGKFWSHYQKIGSDDRGNDIIEFQKGRGIYPDSTYIDTTFVGQYYDTMIDDDDYRYTQRMSRWDGYYDPWFYTSRRWRSYPYWRAGWGWYDPWYYGYAGYYDPWYDPCMLVTAILMRMATMDMAGEARTIIADITVGQAILCGMFIEQVTRVR